MDKIKILRAVVPQRHATSVVSSSCCDARVRKHAVADAAGIAGILGTLTCFSAMALAAAGTISVAAVGTGMGAMAGMSAHGHATATARDGPLAVLVDWGPAITAVSVLAIVIAVGLRRSRAALAALAAGALVYWGMYLQSGLWLMYASLVAGLAIWSVTFAWGRTRFRASRA